MSSFMPFNSKYVYSDTKSTYQNLAMKDLVITIFLFLATRKVLGEGNWSDTQVHQHIKGTVAINLT